jgi:hypothetical protein
MNRGYLRVGMVATVVADAVVLSRLEPDWGQLGADLEAPQRWVQSVGADSAAVTLVGALLWLASVWLAVALVAGIWSLLPGRLGALGSAIGGHLMPAMLRRLVMGAAGASLLLSPTSAFAGVSHAVPAHGTPGHMSNTQQKNMTTVTLIGWPTDRDLHPPAPPPVSWPTDKALRTPRNAGAPMAPDGAVPRQLTNAARTPHDSVITVQPGDSLWLIAAHRLGANATPAKIAAEWPRWYAANEETIGADPDLLTQGVRLSTPASRD